MDVAQFTLLGRELCQNEAKVTCHKQAIRLNNPSQNTYPDAHNQANERNGDSSSTVAHTACCVQRSRDGPCREVKHRERTVLRIRRP
jgi:hypothetical protein